jgi:4-hydroxy-tetrahydrodipicolinate reductase
MSIINVMINGIPGSMAVITAEHLLNDNRFNLIPQSLTGPEISEAEFSLDRTGSKDSFRLKLIQPKLRDRIIGEIKEKEGFFITIDFTHPSAVNGNTEFYCRNGLPFVMGTTGGDRKLLNDTVISSSIPAVISPNMAKQIVGFQALMEYGAGNFPDLFKGYTLEVKESHQKGKADTSGTARAMIKYFNDMGIPFTEEDIEKERAPEMQKTELGIPEEYLEGHAWHTYRLVSGDGTVCFEFTHNVNGRDVYAQGTLDAVAYLDKKVREAEKGKVFTMIDVLKDI